MPSRLDVWRVDLHGTGDAVMVALSPQERVRAECIIGTRERTLWARSRGVLRELLGRHLKADPASLELITGAHGKPRLGAPHEHVLHFNLSHSGELALYVLATHGAVGVDVEVMREPSRRARADPAVLTARVFGAEAAARLEALPPESREREFLRLWTRHEAELKLRGTGIGAASAEHHAGGEAHAEQWIVELDVGPRAVAALASKCDRASEMRLWEWT